MGCQNEIQLDANNGQDKKDTKLPFDVSSFRTLFYENSIGGKSKLENGLKKHIRAILQQGG